MIHDDDIAWARDIVSGKRRGNADAVLARLVLHVHEQDTSAANQGPDRPRNEPENRIAYLPVKVTYEGLYDDTNGPYVKALVRMGPTHETTYSISEACLVDLPLSPPPEAVEWARWALGNRTARRSNRTLAAARFILQAAGKDTDE